MIALLEPRFTTAHLSFSEPPPNGEPAFHLIATDPTKGQRLQNSTEVKHHVTIMNARLLPPGEEPSLDTQGFQTVQWDAKHTNFDDDKEIKDMYYDESAELLREVTGASKVVVFEHSIRRRGTPKSRQPAASAHVDQTLNSSIDLVHRHMPSKEVPHLLKKRFQVVNVWRPINHAAYDWPLAMCDFRTIDVKKDTFPVSIIYPPELQAKPGEKTRIDWSGGQKWWYYNGLETDEAILIKCFDSLQDGSVALFSPHTAFRDPNTSPTAPFRESIELRALVFYD
jgi:hypothetical protein